MKRYMMLMDPTKIKQLDYIALDLEVPRYMLIDKAIEEYIRRKTKKELKKNK